MNVPAPPSRGNFTPPQRPGSSPADAEPAAPATGSRLSPRNWRVPAKLYAILLIPVLVGLVMGGFQVTASVGTWQRAQDAEATARLVRSALTYSTRLVDERDISTEPLLKGDRDNRKVAAARAATDRAAEEFDAAAREMPEKPGLERRLAGFRKAEPKLGKLRAAAFTSRLDGVQTEEGYVAVQHPLTEFASELGLDTGNITSYGRTVYSISLAKAAVSLQRSIGMHLLTKPGPSGGDLARQRTALGSYHYLERIAGEEYIGGGTPQDAAALSRAFEQVSADIRKASAKQAATARSEGERYVRPPSFDAMAASLAALPGTAGADRDALAAKGITAQSWWDAHTAKFDAYRGIEKNLADRSVDEAADIADDARRSTFVTGAVVLVALLAALVLAGLMARQMSRSMQRLRTAALGIAEERLPLIVDQLSRTDPGHVDTRVEPLPITTADEIGEVARAFDHVHREAVRLAAEQALLRGNVNTIFANLSRRNESLVEGQLALITDLERRETDPDQLASLFRLDHLATRMRRNGENLLVLSGKEPGRSWDRPVPLVDVVRAASSEVEQYDRIEVSGIPDAEIHGLAVTDLVHLLAELLENATAFSSPGTTVRLTATRLPDGRIMVEIHDRGIGLAPDEVADINRRLAAPPATRIAALSQRMGLFVVGRLAQRHGIRVQLRPASGAAAAGTTALVMLPDAITHGGGGDRGLQEDGADGFEGFDGSDEFTVSSIIPARPADSLVPLRTAAELGFDDSRYDTAPDRTSAHELDLDPVSRSLRRGERHAAKARSTGEVPDGAGWAPDGAATDAGAGAGASEGAGTPYPERVVPAPQAVYAQHAEHGRHRADGAAPQEAVYAQGGPPLEPVYPQGSPLRQAQAGHPQGRVAGAWPQGRHGEHDRQIEYGRQIEQGLRGQQEQFGGYDGPQSGGRPAPHAQQMPDGPYPAPYGPYGGPYSAYDGSYASHGPYDAYAPYEATNGADGPRHADDGRGGPAYGPDGDPAAADSFSYRSQAESAGLPDENTPSHVDYAPSGPATGATHGRTDRGAPQRGPADRGGSPPAGTPDEERYPDGPRADGGRGQRTEGPRPAQPDGTTPSGLPRRTPRAHLAEGSAPPASAQDGPQVSRAPEDVGGRLSNLRRGILRGRSGGSYSNGRAPSDPNRGAAGPDSTYDQER